MQRLILFVLVCSLLLTACQPTPPKDIVISKRDAHIVPTHEPLPEATVEPVTFPEHYAASQSFYDDRLVINIDADVLYTKDTPYHVYAMEESDFDPVIEQNIITYFCGDKPIYSTHRPLTKAELEADILRKQRHMALGQNEESDEDVLKQIEDIRKQIETAPETAEKIPIDLNDIYIDGTLDLGEEAQADLYICRDSKRLEFNTGRGNYYHHANSREGYRESMDSEIIYTYDNTNRVYEGIPSDEAIQIGDAFLQTVGIEDFQLRQLSMGHYVSGEETTREENCHCHLLTYTRDVAAIPITYENTTIGGRYAPSWSQEYIQLSIDDSGLFDLKWRGCSEVTGNLYENVILKDFETIIDHFIQGLKVRYAYFEDSEDLIQFQLNITDIHLGYMAMPIKDEDGYMLTPVWDFFGVIYSHRQDGDHIRIGENNKGSNGFSFLTINAINGSVIDRSKGY